MRKHLPRRLPGTNLHFIVFIFLPIFLIILPYVLRSGIKEVVVNGETQGTTYSVKAVTGAAPSAVRVVIDARLQRIDAALSNYGPDSEISRFNKQPGTEPFHASAELIAALRLAANVSEVTHGAFDVTVAPLVDAWGFGPDKSLQKALTDADIAALKSRVGYQKVAVDAEASTIRKTQPGVACTLNALAQGYTVDRIAGDLEALGCHDYIIEIGGEVKARGRNVKGQSWWIGIEKPAPGARAIQHVIALDNRAVSTSGDYRNYREEGGVRVCHIIDPRTGRPVNHTLASVSVVHASCALADAYATALMVLGPEEGYPFALDRHLAALFIIREGPNRFTEKATPEFPKPLGDVDP